MKKEIENWWRQAEEDLRVAEDNLNAHPYVAAFFSQQAAEKALKALLFKKEGQVIKIHDLVILGRKCGLSQDLLKGCDELTHVYTETRYADIGERAPFKEFDKVGTETLLKIAKEILRWVEKSI